MKPFGAFKHENLKFGMLVFFAGDTKASEAEHKAKAKEAQK